MSCLLHLSTPLKSKSIFPSTNRLLYISDAIYLVNATQMPLACELMAARAR